MNSFHNRRVWKNAVSQYATHCFIPALAAKGRVAGCDPTGMGNSTRVDVTHIPRAREV
jgi:hypothetical protein